MTIITRKISIRVNEPDKEKKNEWYKQLQEWRRICHKGANMICNHLFVMDQTKELIYFTEEIKLKLADNTKDKEGMLNTSYQNATYRILSQAFKGKIPSDIFNSLNQVITNTYKKEKTEYFSGKRSLRSYKESIPIPFSAKSIKLHTETDNHGNHYFTLFDVPFVTFYGRDRSNNKEIVKRVISGEYDLKMSSIQYKVNPQTNKGDWFLLLVIDIPIKEYKPIKDSQMICQLSIDSPVTAQIKNKIFSIGTRQEYTYQRLQIQLKLRELQKSLKYTKGGKGREKKLAAIERFSEKEKNYIKTKIHTYSAEIVKLAVKNNISKIVLLDQTVKEKMAKNDYFVLRNWGYFGLKTLLKYKASKYNIEVSEETVEVNVPKIETGSWDDISNVKEAFEREFGMIAWPMKKLEEIILLWDHVQSEEESGDPRYILLMYNKPKQTILRFCKGTDYTDFLLKEEEGKYIWRRFTIFENFESTEA